MLQSSSAVWVAKRQRGLHVSGKLRVSRWRSGGRLGTLRSAFRRHQTGRLLGVVETDQSQHG